MGRSALIETLRAEQRVALGSQSPDALLRLAFAMGEEAVNAYAAAEGCSRAEARDRMRRARQRGRQRSRVMEGP